MRFRIVRAAQSVVQECSDFRVRPFARSRIGTNMNALARIHAVGNVAALDDVAVGRIESMMCIRIDDDFQRLAAPGHRFGELDARFRRRPIIAFADVDARRCAGLPALAGTK